MKTPKDINKQLLFLAISLVGTFLIGFVPAGINITFSTFQNNALRAGFLIILLLGDILWVTTKIAAQRTKEVDIWELRNEGEKELENIRASFCNIIHNSYASKDIFVAHFINEFQRLARKISGVADKKELRVVANYFLNFENIIYAFSGEEERIWRYTWALSPGELLFGDLQWRHYFETTAKMVPKEIKAIKSILILDNSDMINSPRIKKLMDYFKTHKGMDCHFIIEEQYSKLSKDSGISQLYNDFGIYGRTLLFLNEQYEPENIGVFTKDHNLIDNYHKFFETMWNAQSLTTVNPSLAKRMVTLEELFEIDNQPISDEENAKCLEKKP